MAECRDILEQLSDYIELEARDELCRAIEQHLAQCRTCRLQVDTVRKTIMLYQADSGVEIPVRVSAALESALAREYRRTPEEGAGD